jgi:rubrerythrin
MNVFAYAMQMELDGKAYYEQLARQATLPGLRTIFTRLAADEQKHYEIFAELQKGQKVMAMMETTALEDAKNVFAQLPRDPAALQAIGGDLSVYRDTTTYRHAMKLEADSFRLYEDAAARESDAGTRALLLKIAAEEHKHFNILENIFHFVNAPSQYLAWGEFSNIDEFRQFGREVDV